MNRIYFLLVLHFLFGNGSLLAQDIPELSADSLQLFQKFQSDSFLDDLELVPYQRKQIKAIQSDFKEEITGIGKSDSKPKAIERILLKSFNEIYNDVLLSHQQARFVQLVHQSEINRSGGSLSRYLTSKKIRDVVGISKKQTNDLRAVYQQMDEEMRMAAKEYNDQVAAILAEEKKETLKQFSDANQAKIGNLLGERNPHDIGSLSLQYFEQILRK